MPNASTEIDPLTQQAIPSTLFGYTVYGYLGRGASSVLYYVTKPGSPQILVLKQVTVNEPKEQRFYDQLCQEYKVGRQVNHPGVRRSIDLHVSKSLFKSVSGAALIMEYCDGYTLEERVPTEPLERSLVFLRAAVAIAAINDAGFVHCDLKPANVVVRAGGQSTVIDLGQTCPIGTVKERVQGTANFMAPEQASLGPVSVQTDVFGLGATMSTGLTQQAMPTSFNVGRKNAKKLEGMTLPPHTIDPSIPEDLSMLVMDCVRTDPQMRPADMHEVVGRLKAVGAAAYRSKTAR